MPPTHLEYLCGLNFEVTKSLFRHSGIVCTIGPASQSPEMLEKMIAAGMNVVRMNFSHGDHKYHANTIKNVHTAIESFSNKLGTKKVVAIALDTKGPEIRTGLIEGSGTAEVVLKTKDNIKLTTNKEYAEKCTKDMLYVDYVNITKIVKPGNHIFVDDGLISLLVKEVGDDTLVCEIENGGKLGSRKGINLPGVPVDLPSISEKDKKDLLFGVEQGVDMIFASFIRNADALHEIRAVLGEKGRNIMVISKIENQQGLHNLDEIIEASDGIMAARGDMGIEIRTEEVCLAQKSIIARCNRVGKPIICATQMLESMVGKPRPTRAEASDVANAIFDGADCVMLSGESAKGKYPVECIRTMSNICEKVEAVLWFDRLRRDLSSSYCNSADEPLQAVAAAACEAASKVTAKAIVVVSECGTMARYISKFRSLCPIVFLTQNEQAARQSLIFRGLYPIIVPEEKGENLKSKLKYGLKVMQRYSILPPDQTNVIVVVNTMEDITTIELNSVKK